MKSACHGENAPRNGRWPLGEAGGGGGPRVLQAPIRQVKRARRLRRAMSLPEVLLWQQLRKRLGAKVQAAVPIGQMTADFACLEHRQII